MRRTISQFCLAVALAFLGVGPALADNQITYALGDGTHVYGTGGKNVETYDVAIRILDSSLVGAQIQAVRIAFPFTEGLSNAKAWLTRELPAIKSSKAGDPDITSKAFDIAKGYTEVVFDQPYTLTSDGVYVGYSFDVPKSEEVLRPVLTSGFTSPDGFYIHTTKVFRTAWRSLYGIAGDLAIQVVLAGDILKDNAASVANLPEVNVAVGEPSTISFSIVNHGCAGVSSVAYSIEVAGQTINENADLTLKPIYGAAATVQATLPAMEQKGNYPCNVTITKVNGMPNEDVAPTATGSLKAYNILPRHRPVLEEYTGLWCGWCPRGFVGLEEMNRLYPDDFIGISYHNGDEMAITNNYPSDVAGFPDAWIDRTYQTDAFTGDNPGYAFEVDKAWEKRRQVFSPAQVEVGSQWIDDNTLRASASVVFPIGSDECPYKVGFSLVADGLTDPGWGQSNYYAGSSEWPSLLDEFVQGSGTVYGLVFNDVIIDNSADRGIVGSLSAPIVDDVAQTVDYDFDISQIPLKLVPADRTKLRVVAMLIDSRTGEIVNANKAQAGSNSATSIRLAHDEGELVKHVRYYDLQGRPVSLPRRGIYLRSETLQNGQVLTRKVRF